MLRQTRTLRMRPVPLSGHFASRATCGGFYANLIGKCHNSWHLVGCANFPPRSSNPVGCAILCFEGLRPSRSPASLWRPLFLFRLRLHKNSASTRTAPWREPHSKGLRPSRSLRFFVYNVDPASSIWNLRLFVVPNLAGCHHCSPLSLQNFLCIQTDTVNDLMYQVLNLVILTSLLFYLLSHVIEITNSRNFLSPDEYLDQGGKLWQKV